MATDNKNMDPNYGKKEEALHENRFRDTNTGQLSDKKETEEKIKQTK